VISAARADDAARAAHAAFGLDKLGLAKEEMHG